MRAADLVYEGGIEKRKDGGVPQERGRRSKGLRVVVRGKAKKEFVSLNL